MKIIFSLIVCLITLQAAGQVSATRLKLYIDCQETLCDLDFMRQQLTITDFVRDRQTTDVHILITTRAAGNGGQQYTVQLIGMHRYSHLTDTVSFFTELTQTEDEKRTLMLGHIKMALVPFLAAAGQAGQIVISFAPDADNSGEPAAKDKWNYWVITMGGGASLSGDKNYKETYLRGNVSVSRTTDKSKVDFSFYNSSSKNTYKFDDSNGKSVLKTSNDYMEASHSYVQSLNAKWSAAYEVKFEKSTYDNLDSEVSFGTGIEYNIYPYKSSTTKFLVVRYMVFAEKRKYMQETIYNKTSQMLFSNDLGVYASFRQPWGSISSFVIWYNYLHDASKNNLSFNANVELRLFKGVSLGFYGNASIINDQLNLPRGGASPEEILLRLKALSTNFNYYTGINLSYRFGSKFNNFVNPRFTEGR